MTLIRLSPQNQKRLRRFKSIRRGWVSLWFLVGAYLLSLGVELLHLPIGQVPAGDEADELCVVRRGKDQQFRRVELLVVRERQVQRCRGIELLELRGGHVQRIGVIVVLGLRERQV